MSKPVRCTGLVARASRCRNQCRNNDRPFQAPAATFSTTTLRPLRRRVLASQMRREIQETIKAEIEAAKPKNSHEFGVTEQKLNFRDADPYWEPETPIPPDTVDKENRTRVSGFFAYGEEGDNPEEDPVFEGDDITSSSHAELEQVRELREFNRVIAWDMPLLHQFIKPFEPPTAATPLRFRYTTYMGEAHPASRKVVCSFAPANLPDLSRVSLNKLVKLLGARIDPRTGWAKISCEMFPTPAQNKRYIGDLVQKLLTEARDLSKETFEDIPFDFRFNKRKSVPVFPEEWKMTEQRKKMLLEEREGVLKVEQRRVDRGLLVEGSAVAEGKGETEEQIEMEPVMARSLNQGSMGNQPRR